MKAEIINIGDELLIGQVVNTNASWMAQELNLSGFEVSRVVVIHDKREDILDALNTAAAHADIILLSGGLGPTSDDITKQTLCEYFDTKLIFHEASYKNIERLFGSRGIVISEINRQQAELPENCKPLLNSQGTAPGMLFEKNGKVFISLPGVPFEMKMLMTVQVIPELIERFKATEIIHRTINTTGIGESSLADEIKEWESSLPEYIKLAYLPAPGIVRLRLSGQGADRDNLIKEIAFYEKKLQKIIPEYIFGYDDETLEVVLGKLLIEKNLTISTAESCTGGYIAHRITSVSGSSRYFKGSIVAYSNEIKNSILSVPFNTIEKYGAVSSEVVSLMAEKARQLLNSDVSIAVSGIAGPEGGTPEKPVGTVWIAIATNNGTNTFQYLFGDNRERNIIRTGAAAMHLMIREIKKNKK
jgi:nicotinamide-nucleotide amidase